MWQVLIKLNIDVIFYQLKKKNQFLFKHVFSLIVLFIGLPYHFVFQKNLLHY